MPAQHLLWNHYHVILDIDLLTIAPDEQHFSIKNEIIFHIYPFLHVLDTEKNPSLFETVLLNIHDINFGRVKNINLELALLIWRLIDLLTLILPATTQILLHNNVNLGYGSDMFHFDTGIQGMP